MRAMPDERDTCPHCGYEGDGYREEPGGYVAWFEFAEVMTKRGYVQSRCPGCHRWAVWTKPEVEKGVKLIEAALVTEQKTADSFVEQELPVADGATHVRVTVHGPADGKPEYAVVAWLAKADDAG